MDPWRVRIRLGEGQKVPAGAGVLLGDQNVLTCAHVLDGEDDEVLVDFVGVRDGGTGIARVVPGCFVPPMDDQRGDVALLRLDRPLAAGIGTQLRRTALSWDRTVRMFGFPLDVRLRDVWHGVWARATLAGEAGPGMEWLQMNARSMTEQRVRSGFSGAGVADEQTGAVLGIVVGEYTDEGASLSWMIPVETILYYLPRVAEWVSGESPVDPVFSQPVEPVADQAGVTKDLIEWLGSRGTGDVVRIVVGPELAALHRIVPLTSREHRPAAVDGPAPAVGSIDLALDATGRSLDEISRRIVDRTGIALDESSRPSDQVRAGLPPMTLVVLGVDDATQPEILVQEVLRPLAERGTRLVLGFRRASSRSLALARSWEVGTVPYRLDRLADRITVLGQAEQDLVARRAKLGETGSGLVHAPKLRLRLSAIRQAGNGPQWTEALDSLERSVTRAQRRIADAGARPDASLATRDEQRGLLDVYRSEAVLGGVVEDPGLVRLYQRAYDLLHLPPLNLPAARAAVRAYGDAVRRALEDKS